MDLNIKNHRHNKTKLFSENELISIMRCIKNDETSDIWYACSGTGGAPHAPGGREGVPGKLLRGRCGEDWENIRTRTDNRDDKQSKEEDDGAAEAAG